MISRIGRSTLIGTRRIALYLLPIYLPSMHSELAWYSYFQRLIPIHDRRRNHRLGGRALVRIARRDSLGGSASDRFRPSRFLDRLHVSASNSFRASTLFLHVQRRTMKKRIETLPLRSPNSRHNYYCHSLLQTVGRPAGAAHRWNRFAVAAEAAKSSRSPACTGRIYREPG